MDADTEETVRNLNLLDQYRDASPRVLRHYGSAGDETCGVFDVPSPIDRANLHIIASSGEGWDHVSISRNNRCPNWQEMEHVKRLFFKDDETAIQYHVPPSDHISIHPYCLHLWRPTDQEFPRPPAIMVGPVKETA